MIPEQIELYVTAYEMQETTLRERRSPWQICLAKTAHYPHITQVPNFKSQHLNPDQQLAFVLFQSYSEISSISAHNLLSNGRNSDWVVRMVIRISTKFNHLILSPPLIPP